VHRYNCAHIRAVQTDWKNLSILTPEIYCRNLFLDNPLISIVDDDEAICRALRALVQSLGYRAVTYGSADAFLASKIAPSSQCIITDMQMPGLSGLDLKRRLNEEGCETPVIMITARLEAYLDAEARKIGAICLLRKPFEATALISCLERALAL
jgi:FixJ family two-component response regulator